MSYGFVPSIVTVEYPSGVCQKGGPTPSLCPDGILMFEPDQDGLFKADIKHTDANLKNKDWSVTEARVFLDGTYHYIHHPWFYVEKVGTTSDEEYAIGKIYFQAMKFYKLCSDKVRCSLTRACVAGVPIEVWIKFEGGETLLSAIGVCFPCDCCGDPPDELIIHE